MRRLVGLLVVGVLVISGVVVAVASTSATRAPAQAPKLSPIAPFFSLTPPRPQNPRHAPTVVVPNNGYSCAVAANGSPCSRNPCRVFVAPLVPPGGHVVETCARIPQQITLREPIATR